MQPLDEEKQRLAAEAMGRAEAMKKRYERLFPRYAQDFESSAFWGAVRAASSWDANGDQTWERWSKLHIRGEIAGFLRSEQEHNLECGWADGGPSNVADKRRNEDTGLEKTEEAERLLSMLPERLARLMRHVYYDGMTPAMAGKAIGVTPNHGCKLHKKAIAYLKERVA